MTMTSYSPSGLDARRFDANDAEKPLGQLPAIDDILRKPGDRLIRDIGFTREELQGPAKTFWREWLRIKQPWQW